MSASFARRLVIIGPLWFSAIIIVAGRLTPGYSHASQAISELGQFGATLAPVVNFGGFIPLGIIIFWLALALGRQPAAGLPRTTVCLLFGLTGTAVIIAGIFPCDPGCLRQVPTGIIHAVASITFLLVAAITPPLVAIYAIRTQPSHRRFHRPLSLVRRRRLFRLER